MQYEGNKLILPELRCNCGLKHTVPDLDVYVGSGILKNAPEYLAKKLSGNNILLIADNNTYAAAGQRAADILKAAGYNVNTCVIEREEEMDPDAEAIGEILLHYDNNTDFLLAVGSGSISDITRYVAVCTRKPFAIIGTAPSMDGYTSINSSLIFNSIKVSKYTKPAEVIICDIKIMKNAPYHLFQYGFGDLLGKYIARADWTLSSYINNEPICGVCIDLVMHAVQKCMDNIHEIKNRSDIGTKSLIEALILSGLTILIISNSRPVASNDHNMAHVWEMVKLYDGEKPPSHGLSVGVGTLYCLKFYEIFFAKNYSRDDIAALPRISAEEKEAEIKAAFGEVIGKAMIIGNPSFYLSSDIKEERVNAFFKYKDIIREKISFLPSYESIKAKLEYLGAPVSAEQLGISKEQLKNSLLYTKDYRNRYNLFNLAEEMGVLSGLINEGLRPYA